MDFKPDNEPGRLLARLGMRVSNAHRFNRIVRIHFVLNPDGVLFWRRHNSHRHWLDDTPVLNVQPWVRLQVMINDEPMSLKFNLNDIMEILKDDN